MPTMPDLPGAWNACCRDFLQAAYDRSGSESTRLVYMSVLETFFRAGIHPESVTRADVQAFLNARDFHPAHKGREVGPATKNQRRNVLHAFYQFASSYEVNGAPLYTKANPAAGFPYLKPPHRYKAMSEADLEQFFLAIPRTPKGQRDRVLFLFYLFTGRRRKEALLLQWKDIQASIIVDDDGTRRPGHVYQYVRKGHARERTTKELPAMLYEALLDYLKQTGRLPIIAPDDYLFVATINAPASRRHLQPSYVNRLFRSYCRKAGLSPEYTLHSLRHSSAYHRYAMGEDIRSLQRFLDHTSLATTSIYLQSLSGVSDPGAKLLEERFGHLGKL